MTTNENGLATAHISFRERIDAILSEELPSLTESQEELIAEARSEYGSYAETPAEYERAYENFEEQKTNLRGEANALGRFIAAYCWKGNPDEVNLNGVATEAEAYLNAVGEADAEFTITELTGGQLAVVEDDVVKESYQVDPQRQEVSGSPKSGYGRILSCKQAINEWPDGCPTDDKGRCEVGDFSHQVQDFLFDRINNLNAVGDVNLGNSSFREAMSTDDS